MGNQTEVIDCVTMKNKNEIGVSENNLVQLNKCHLADTQHHLFKFHNNHISGQNLLGESDNITTKFKVLRLQFKSLNNFNTKLNSNINIYNYLSDCFKVSF